VYEYLVTVLDAAGLHQLVVEAESAAAARRRVEQDHAGEVVAVRLRRPLGVSCHPRPAPRRG